VMDREGGRCKQLLNDLKETTGYWKFKEEALERTLWRTRFGRGHGHVVRQTVEWVNDWMNDLEYQAWKVKMQMWWMAMKISVESVRKVRRITFRLSVL
jgi:phenylalanyl-tRNA synthetase alpha subunit